MRLNLSDSSKLLKIDLKDRKILEILQHNARESHTQIAKKAGLSKDAVTYRIKNYVSKGLIQGYRTIIDVNKLGYTAYHLFLQLKTPAKEAEEGIVSKLKNNPFTRAIIKFSGKYDFQIALIAKDIKEFDSILTGILSECSPYVQSYDVVILSDTYVSRSFPQSFLLADFVRTKQLFEDVKIDNTDREILSMISDNATINYYKISQALGISSDTVKYRINKMKNSRIIKKFIPAINYKSIGYTFYCLMMNINLIDHKLRELLLHDKNIIWAVKAVGKYNLLCYICVKDSSSLHETINNIREYYSGQITDYEILLAYEEYKYTYYPEVLKGV